MRFEMYLNFLLLIPEGIVVIIDFLSLPLYFWWMKSGEFRKVKRLLLFKPFSTIICIYFMFTQFGAGFFLGAAYLLLAFGVALVLFIVYLVLIIRLRKELGFPNRKYILNSLIGLIIVVSIATPPIVYLPIKERCTEANSDEILMISRLLRGYLVENGKYPNQLDELVPTYFSHLPAPSCNFLSGIPRAFQLSSCEGDNPIIYVRTVDGVGFDLYDAIDGHYTRIHSFLDYPDPGNCP